MPNSKKIALVTGGTRGIGAEISLHLKKAGYKVVANYHSNDEAAEKFAKTNHIELLKFDVGNFKATHTAIEKMVRDFGTPQVVVNNAGITRDGFLHKTTEADWDAVMNTNLKSAFNVCQAVIGHMRSAEYGRIINISSINAQKGQIGQTNYCAAKAGLIGFTKALALEGARKNITANVVCPGYIETDMTANIPAEILSSIVQQIPMGRMGQAHEVASMVAFLASAEAAYVTGAVLSVNGGQFLG